MPDLQGIVSFTGIAQGAIKGGSFTLSHGITPSSGTITVVPQGAPYIKGGTLSFEYGRERFSFPDCSIADVVETAGDSGTLLTLHIVDRRWKWENQHISGTYNLRATDGQIRKEPFDFEKTPQQLAKLLCDAMGEAGADVSRLPEGEDRPEVNWDYANPAQELANLAELYGCRVVLGLDNRVRIVVDGEGPVLPLTGEEVTDSYGIDPPERPDSLLFVAGPTRYQAQFELEPVGLDMDGKIKPINQLSYKPGGGWEKEFPGMFSGVPDDIDHDDVNDNTPFDGNTDKRKRRRLCMEWVFRAYRIKQEAGSTVDLFGSAELLVTKLEQMLPLNDGLVEFYLDPKGAEKPLPEYVEGLRWEMGMATLNRNGRTTEGFSLDRERGIVMFSDYMYRLDSSGDIQPAQLYLTCSVSLKDNKKFAPQRYTKERKLPGKPFGTGPRVVARDDIYKTIVVEYGSDRTPTGKKENTKKIDPHINFYLDQAAKEFEPVETLTKRYVGWQKIEPDGATHQVTWSVDESGAYTEASQNSEHKRNIPNYAERRRREKAKAWEALTPKVRELYRALGMQP